LWIIFALFIHKCTLIRNNKTLKFTLIRNNKTLIRNNYLHLTRTVTAFFSGELRNFKKQELAILGDNF